MFEASKRKAHGSDDSAPPGWPGGSVLVAAVRAAGSPQGSQIPIFDPMISQSEMWRATDAYADRGVGSLGELYYKICGLGFDEYWTRGDDVTTTPRKSRR